MSIEYRYSNFGEKVLIVDSKDGICLKMSKEKFDLVGHEGIEKELTEIKNQGIVPTAYMNDKVNTVYLFVTNRCNLKCEFCSMRSNNNSIKKLDLDWNSFNASFFKKIKDLSPRKIIISGGEPLLFKDLPILLRKLNEETESKIIIQSNGWLLTSEIIEQIKGLVHSFEISTSHFKDLKRLKDLAREMKESSLDLVLTFIYEKEKDLSNMKVIMDIAAEYDANFLLHFVDYAGSAADNEHTILDSKSRLNVYYKFCEYILLKGYADKRFAEGLFVPIMPSHPCSAYGKMAAFFPDGNIYMCHSLQEEKYHLCSIDDNENVVEQINRKKVDESIKKLFDVNQNEKCKNCKFNLICGGFCPNLLSKETLQDCELRKIMYVFNIFFFDYNKTPHNNLESFKLFCEKKEYEEYL